MSTIDSRYSSAQKVRLTFWLPLPVFDWLGAGSWLSSLERPEILIVSLAPDAAAARASDPGTESMMGGQEHA
jgi:hypothetical protein